MDNLNLKLLPKIIVVLGPTASGKSDLAVKLALRLSSRQRRGLPEAAGQAKKKFGINGAEIISADSRQVYKGLDIGSGKITKKEMRGVPHHLLDVASPRKTFTVAQYQKLAKKAIKKILAKNKLPIICGGTGFYIDTLIYNYQLPEVPPQLKLRKQLEKKSVGELFNQLKKIDPRRAKTIDRYNKRRLIRALEIVLTTKKSVPLLDATACDSVSSYDVLFIGVKKSPEELKKLIAKRLKKRLKQGMINEVKKLRHQGLSWQRLDDFGLEYRFVSRYLRGLITKKEMVDLILKESWRYAKRQMTWFSASARGRCASGAKGGSASGGKKDKETIWIDNPQKAFAICRDFLCL